MTGRFELTDISYGGWSHCAKLTSGRYEMVVTAEVGPRIISIKSPGLGGNNVLKEYSAMLGTSGAGAWQIYGGHRLWCAPETREKTYYPDNHAVRIEQRADEICFIPPVETSNQIQKEIGISLVSEDIVRVRHRIKNLGGAAVTVAPWALTVMRPGGTAILPLPPRGAHSDFLLPTGRLSMWAYTDFSDPRYAWGKEYLFLRQDERSSQAQKIGIYPDFTSVAWLGYALPECTLLKSCRMAPSADYPDLGVALEVYTDHEMLELETLAPLRSLAPQQTVEHEERWMIAPEVHGQCGDVTVKKALSGAIEELVESWKL